MITNCNSIYKNIKYFNLLFIRMMKRMVTQRGRKGQYKETLLHYVIIISHRREHEWKRGTSTSFKFIPIYLSQKLFAPL